MITDNIFYVIDRHGICYAVVRLNQLSNNETLAMSTVPCERVGLVAEARP